jgi:hypothetical protein
MSYLSHRPTDLTIDSGDQTRTVPLGPGFRNVYLQMNGDFNHLVLTQPGGRGSLCIGDLVIGFAEPVPTQSGTS